MACDCFLALDKVSGESEDPDFPGTIEVRAWNWGASASGDRVTGNARRAAADLHRFTFRHRVDAATSALMSLCMTGLPIPKVKLTQRRAGGKASQQFIEIEFSEVRIVDVALAMAPVDDQIDTGATVTFAFNQVTFDYTPQSKAGSAKSGRHSFHWQADTTK